MPQSKLNELKKEIQRLRPEIMELKFGCELIVKTSFNDGTGRRLPLNKTIKMVNETAMSIKEFEEQSHKKIIEILGRPITLEDVLAVLPGNRNWFIDNAGVFYKSHLSKHTYDCLGVKWTFGKPLDNQSEETINFIHSLIFK